MASEPTMDALAKSAAGGDREAMEQLARRVFPVMCRGARRVRGTGQESEDHAQNRWCKLLQDPGQLAGIPDGRVDQWLATLVRNDALNARARMNRERNALGLHDGWTNAPDPEDVPAPPKPDALEVEECLLLLHGLSPADRELWMLAEMLDMDAREISEHLGRGHATVRRQVRDARARMATLSARVRRSMEEK